MMLLDLVTMPLTEISLFMSSGFRSLMTLNSAKLKGRTCAISRFEALAATDAHVCCTCLLHMSAAVIEQDTVVRHRVLWRSVP